MFAGPILIDFKASVTINFRPACGAGATAISFHMPPLPWPWPPISARGMITAAIMALVTAPFNAMLESAKGKLVSMAAASNQELFKKGFVADLIGSSHVGAPAGKVSAAGKVYALGNPGDRGTFDLQRVFPMFNSASAFLGFLTSLLPLPIANGSVTIATPTVSVQDAPLGMMIPLGAVSCSDIPLVPNGMVIGLSNVLAGMSMGDFLGQLAWGAIQGAASRGFQGGLRKAGNAAARQIANSSNPRLQNVAQRVNDFVGGKNCIAEGHPVDVVSGTVFTEQTDFTLYGAQPFTWSRFYNSRALPLPGDVMHHGPGWRHPLDEVLVADTDAEGVRTLALRDREGRVLGFALPTQDGAEDFHPQDKLTLKRVDGRTYELRQTDADWVKTFVFPGGEPGEAVPADYMPAAGNRAHLAKLWTPGGGEGLRPEWDEKSGWLLGFTDASDRRVICKHDPHGRITDLRLVHGAGPDGRGKACDVHLASYRYDSAGQLTQHIDRNRNPRRNAYDERGRLSKETDRNGYAFHFRYDAADRCVLTHGDDNAYWVELEYQPKQTIAKDALGGTTRYQYDDDFHVVSVIDPEGAVTKTEYTEQGWKAKVVDANEHATEHEYDARGRVIAHTAPDGAKTTYEYAGDRLLARTDAAGNTTTFEWKAGEPAAVVSPLGHRTELRRDALGRVEAVTQADGSTFARTWTAHGLVQEDTDAAGVRTRYRYDLLGQVVEIERQSAAGQAAPRTTTVQRDAEGRVIALDGPEGRRERYSRLPEGQPVELVAGTRKASRRYEGWGRLVEHTDPLGRTTRVDWDLHHFVTAVHQPGERTWRYERDKVGRVRAMHTPDGLTVRYQRDPGGRVLAEQRPDRKIERTYDAADRVTKVKWGRGGETKLAYDTLGRLVAVTGTTADGDAERPLTYAYDADGRLTSETQADHVLRWQRDALGRVVRRSASWGATERFQWAAGQLTGLVDPLGGQHQFEHDGWGRRHTWRQAGGGAWHARFDDLDRLIQAELRVPGGDIASDTRLTWSDDDTLVADERHEGGRARRAKYSYDDAGRLTGWSADGAQPLKYSYDDADNLVREGAAGERTYRADRLLSDAAGHGYRYDPNGRLVARQGPEGTLRLWFDDRDRLARVHTADDRVVHHRYDAL
ncbi:MAG: RHS repeat protein, partial [Myxococcales bacterium]|nr:RHS repeat protein [Myxococcales bacterium]